jgi:peptide/nickel transport system ATP-binding protein
VFQRCAEVPPLEARSDQASQHLDRCWLTPDQKRSLRQVDGQIGLRTKETVIS